MALTEKEAFELLKSKLGDVVFVEPKGSDSSFPDFGIRYGEINVYVEHKQDWKAQMSGLSSWEFSSGTFRSNVVSDEALRIVRLMQRQNELKNSAKELIELGKQVLGKKIGVALKSTMFSGKSKLLSEFDRLIEGKKVLGNISSRLVGSVMVSIYKSKFRESLTGGRKHVCLMMFDDEVWILDSVGMTGDDHRLLAKALGSKQDKLPRFSLREAYIQVRISPRVSSGRIDTRALINLPNKQAISFKGLKVS